MQVPLLDLKAQYATIRDEVEAAIAEVMESQHFILGPKVEECEKAIARYSGCSHGIGVSSGSDALLACLMAENIGSGDEVITTPYTFFATVGAIARARSHASIRRHRSEYIQSERFTDPRQGYIENSCDCPGAFVWTGGTDGRRDGSSRTAWPSGHRRRGTGDRCGEQRPKRAGSIGHYGCFSFFPSKNLGAAGDGGMIVTNDAATSGKAEMPACSWFQTKVSPQDGGW